MKRGLRSTNFGEKSTRNGMIQRKHGFWYKLTETNVLCDQKKANISIFCESGLGVVGLGTREKCQLQSMWEPFHKATHRNQEHMHECETKKERAKVQVREERVCYSEVLQASSTRSWGRSPSHNFLNIDWGSNSSAMRNMNHLHRLMETCWLVVYIRN